MESEQPSSKQKVIATLAVLLVIVVIVAGAAAMSGNKSDDSTTETTTPTVATNNNAPATESATTDNSTTGTTSYKDGSYTATGDYISPGGQEFITITVDLKDGKVVETSAVSGAKSREAKGYQADFISGYESRVVGKNIDDIDLSRVSGSSLTSRGFNDALDQIRDKARG